MHSGEGPLVNLSRMSGTPSMKAQIVRRDGDDEVPLGSLVRQSGRAEQEADQRLPEDP